MAKKGKTYLADIEFTDAEVLEKFGFPCIFILQDDSGKIIKQIAYDSTGNKSVTTFSGSEPDRVLQIGSISATTTSLTLGLHSSGENKVKFSGQILSRNVEQSWSFPAVAGQQIFQIYAVDDADVFHLALPGEEIPEGALLVRSLTLTEDGELAEIDDDFNLRAENAWRQYTIPNNDPFIIQMDNSLAARFEIKLAPGVTAPKIGLVRQKAGKSFWNGSEFTFWNNSDIDIELIEETYTDTIFKNLTFEPANIKAGNYAQIFEKAGVLVVGKFSEDPDLSPYALQSALTTEASTRASEDLKKLDKPLLPNNVNTNVILGDGSTKPLSEIGGVPILNVLNSTSTTSALSANMGKTLNDTKQNIPTDSRAFYGDKAGRVSTGANNVGVGKQALYSSTTGLNNVAVGFNAAYFSTTGSGIVAIGNSALSGFSNTFTGSDIIAIGASAAGDINGTANSFIAIGGSSARKITNANNFISIGGLAGFNVTTATKWVAIGLSSAYSITTGTGFIVIGNEAGRYSNGGPAILASATNSIYIGNTSMSLNTSSNNEIVIGYYAIGNGDNTVTIGNTAITGLYLGGANAKYYAKNAAGISLGIGVSNTGRVYAIGNISRSWGAIGHSIWNQDGVLTGIQTLVKQQFQFTSYGKYTYDGNSLGGLTSGDTSSILETAKTDLWTSKSIFTYDSITNDFKRNIPLGTTTDFLTNTGITTYYGALRVLHEKLKALNPDYQMICSNALKRNNASYTSWSSNTAGSTLTQYSEALQWVANRLSWKFINQFQDSTINDDNLSTFTSDGLHPNNAGYLRIAHLWVNAFRDLLSI